MKRDLVAGVVRVAAAVAAVGLAGCSGLGAKDAQRYFVLEPPLSSALASNGAPANGSALFGATGAAPAASAPTLLVAPTTASAFYDTQEIAFSRVAGQRGYYQFSSWTEPPSRSLDRLIVARLAASGAFAAVAMTTSGVRGNLVLRTSIVEMYHDASSTPGRAVLRLEAELGDPQTRKLLAQRAFATTLPVATADAAGAVQAFDAGVGQVLDELVVWARAQATLAH